MQEEQADDHLDTGGTNAGGAARILEGPDRVTTLTVMNREIAFSSSARSSLMSGLYQSELGAFRIEWRRWYFCQLYWTQKSALLFLQGGTLQRVLDPWLVLKADPRALHDPCPGANNVVLAELFDQPSKLTHQQLFKLLLPEAGPTTF